VKFNILKGRGYGYLVVYVHSHCVTFYVMVMVGRGRFSSTHYFGQMLTLYFRLVPWVCEGDERVIEMSLFLDWKMIDNYVQVIQSWLELRRHCLPLLHGPDYLGYCGISCHPV
jgi:hypothetical protein